MVKQIKSNVIVSQINRILNKNNIFYDYNAYISHAFIGEPFYVNSKRLYEDSKLPIWGYDINSAYKSVIINKKFPLSMRLGKKKTELGIYEVKLNKRTMRKKFPEFDYNIYENLKEFQLVEGNNKTDVYYMSNIDYEIFTTLYDSDIKINEDGSRWFQDIGELPQELKNLCQEYYDLKQQVKIDPTMSDADKEEWKTQDEVSFYGLHARKLDKHVKQYKNVYKEDCSKPIFNGKVKGNMTMGQHYAVKWSEYKEWEAATSITKCRYGVRKPNVVIAMFQTAYLRKLELDMFLKYNKHIIYMNTDSMHLDYKAYIKISKKIGDWKLEYDGEEILYIRRNGYIIFNKDGSHKLNIGGIIDKQFTQEQLDQLELGHSILAKSKNDKGEIVDIELNCSFVDTNR